MQKTVDGHNFSERFKHVLKFCNVKSNLLQKAVI